MERGFSFTEVMVSLFLVLSMSWVLLKQQWQLQKMLIQAQQAVQAYCDEQNQHERAMSLIELMLSLALALTLLSLLLSLHGSSYRHFLNAETVLHQLSDIQRSLDLMHSVIQGAGYTPCLPIGALQSLNAEHSEALTALRFDPNNSSALYSYQMGDKQISVSKILHAHRLILASAQPFNLSPPLLIADCHHAEVISNFSQMANSVNLAQPLNFSYYPPIYLGEWQVVGFRQDQQYLYYEHHHAERLLSNLKSLSFELGNSSGHQRVHVTMRLADTPSYALDIRLRNPGAR